MSDGSISVNLAANILEQIDRLAHRYKKNGTTDSLIKFVQFRSDCIDILLKLTFMELYSPDELWNCECYIDIVTDELDIFHGEKTIPNERDIESVKMWRSCRRNDD